MQTSMSRRWSVGLGIVSIALGVLTYTAYAAFDGASSRSQSITTSVYTFTAGGVDRFNVDVNDIQPGDTVVRAVDIVVSATEPFATDPVLSTVATTSSALDTDTGNGLQLSIDRCDQAWDETLTSGVPTDYTCGGTEGPVLHERPVIGSNLGINFDKTDGATNHWVVRLHFPDGAPDSMAGDSSTIQFNISAASRAETVR
ncbi:MAG TPA: hypothetical protein VFR41_02615 [Acidimicrobiia bacterium]|nr:hypothetical protein [Acidimicrobiia bacterium]